MHIYVTRDSLCAGDDGDAPHTFEFDLPDGAPPSAAVERVSKSGYLPSISGGNATWSVASSQPIAIVAQQWAEPRHFQVLGGLRDLDFGSGTLRLHFNYHAQIDPEVVYKVLWGIRLRAV